MHRLPFYMQVYYKLLPYTILGGYALWSRSKKPQTSLNGTYFGLNIGLNIGPKLEDWSLKPRGVK